MKKLFLGLIVAMSLVSCGDKFEEVSYQEAMNAKFESEFVNTFGAIDKNQDWGFNETIKLFDYTDKSITRGHNVEGNLWYQKWERPVNVTDAEKAKVIAEFSKVREGATHTENLPWENYWVQQVYQGTSPSLDGTNNEVYPSDVMNQLMAWNYNTRNYEHVNNFNNADNQTEYTDDITHEKFIGTTLMVNMGSGEVDNQFGYHNTSDSKYHYEYIILNIDGAYYVGFDIVGYHPIGQDANANMDVTRDWIFNDWIVKISPAKFNMEGATRIIAEDLGADKSDFDYNDVVFDAKIVNESVEVSQYNCQNRLIAYIALQAAGGTLPLTVGGVEVHDKFGVSTSTMVNTGIVSKPTVYFKLDLGAANYNADAAEVIKSIPVVVKNGNNVVILEVETGRAPEKIAVSTSFVWCKERVPIQSVYTKFPLWVQDKSVVWY